MRSQTHTVQSSPKKPPRLIMYIIYTNICSKANICNRTIYPTLLKSNNSATWDIVLRLCVFYTSGVLIGMCHVDRQQAGGHWRLERCLDHEPQNLTSVRQHDLWIKALNKSNTYLSLMRSVRYLSCR